MRRSRHDGGKGDKPIAPQDQEAFDNNWDQIFKAKKTEDSYPCEVIRGTNQHEEKELSLIHI